MKDTTADLDFTGIVRNAWSGAKTTQQAADNLARMMRDDPEIDRLVIDYFRPRLPLLAVTQIAGHDRARAWDASKSSVGHLPSEALEVGAPGGLADIRVAALQRGNLATLMDMRLPRGKRLGDATRDDVQTAASFYRVRAKGHQDKADWLDRIAAKLPDKGRVRDHLKEYQLAGMKDKANAA